MELYPHPEISVATGYVCFHHQEWWIGKRQAQVPVLELRREASVRWQPDLGTRPCYERASVCQTMSHLPAASQPMGGIVVGGACLPQDRGDRKPRPLYLQVALQVVPIALIVQPH